MGFILDMKEGHLLTTMCVRNTLLEGAEYFGLAFVHSRTKTSDDMFRHTLTWRHYGPNTRRYRHDMQDLAILTYQRGTKRAFDVSTLFHQEQQLELISNRPASLRQVSTRPREHTITLVGKVNWRQASRVLTLSTIGWIPSILTQRAMLGHSNPWQVGLKLIGWMLASNLLIHSNQICSFNSRRRL